MGMSVLIWLSSVSFQFKRKKFFSLVYSGNGDCKFKIIPSTKVSVSKTGDGSL